MSFKIHGNSVDGIIKSRAGKAHGLHRNWYNVESDSGINAYAFSRVMDLNVFEKSETKTDGEPPDEVVMFNKSVSDGAKRTELDTWKKLDVYKSVKDDGQDRVSTRWVL